MWDKQPPRTALIISCYPGEIDEFVKTVNSIRQQKVVPWHVRIRDYGGSATGDPKGREAIEHLQLFCPNVKTLPYSMGRSSENTLVHVLDELLLMEWDVLFHFSKQGVELERTAMYAMSKPFLESPNLPYHVSGRNANLLYDTSWQRFVGMLLRRSRQVNAYRRVVVHEWYLEQKEKHA